MTESKCFPKNGFVVGIKETKRALEKKEIQKVYLARDTDIKKIESLEKECIHQNIPVDRTMDSLSLGKACGIAVKAAAAGIFK